MEKLQLKKYFNVLLTGSDVNRKKPNPEILLKTLAEMDISNEEAVVIEDSQAGIQAAKAANIKCVICPDNYISYKNFDFSRADAIIKTLKQIKI
jgi:putative hydrolase of the HAD superfamily